MEVKLASVMSVSHAGDITKIEPRSHSSYCCGNSKYSVRNCFNYNGGTTSQSFSRTFGEDQRTLGTDANTFRGGQSQSVRLIFGTQFWTCITVKYGTHKLTALLDTGSDITVVGS